MRTSAASLAACSAALLTWLAPALEPSARAQAVGFAPGVGVAPSGVMLGVTPTVTPDRMYVRMGMDVGFNQVTGFTPVQVPAAVSGGGNAGATGNAATINGLLGNLGGGAGVGGMGNGGAAVLNGGPFGAIGAVSGVGTYGAFGMGFDPLNTMGSLNTFGGYAGPGSSGSFGQVQGFDSTGNFVGGAGTFGPANTTSNPGGRSTMIGNPLGSKGPRAAMPGEGPEAMSSASDPFQQAAEAPTRAASNDRQARAHQTARPRTRSSRNRVLVRSPAQSTSKAAAPRAQDGSAPTATSAPSSTPTSTRSRP